MNKVAALEIALQHFASICAEKDVPVGFSVTTSGKFIVKYSLSERIELFIQIELAVNHIINAYKKLKNG